MLMIENMFETKSLLQWNLTTNSAHIYNDALYKNTAFNNKWTLFK